MPVDQVSGSRDEFLASFIDPFRFFRNSLLIKSWACSCVAIKSAKEQGAKNIRNSTGRDLRLERYDGRNDWS
jgi:hypothetical protein